MVNFSVFHPISNVGVCGGLSLGVDRSCVVLYKESDSGSATRERNVMKKIPSSCTSLRSFKLLLAVFLIGLGLSACSAPQELMVLIDKNRADEAWDTAYNAGGTLGYVRGFYDDENKVVEYNRIDMDGPPLPMNLYIKMEMDETEDATVLWLYGMDKDIAGEDDEVMQDMEKIVKSVELCCAAPDGGEFDVSVIN